MKISNFIWLFTVVVSIIVGWGTFNLYTNVNEPFQESETAALNYLKANTEFDEVRSVNFYHGSKSYQVFESIDETEGEEVFIWVANSLDDYIVKPKNTGLGLDKVIDFVEKELKPQKLISIKLGIENIIPLYEIIYIDDQDRYSYYYISFKDGTYLKHYHLKV